jgi:hypothetical protein
MATFSPHGAQNFSSQKIYTVTAENNTTKAYTVTVVVSPQPSSSTKAITSISLEPSEKNDDDPGPFAGVINERTHTITFSIDARYMYQPLDVAAIVHTGAYVESPADVFFYMPQDCTVYAADGSSQTYALIVMWKGFSNIHDIDLTGYDIEPNDGQLPNPGNIHVDGGYFTIGPISWTDRWGNPVGLNEYIDISNRQYNASFTLTADDGYLFGDAMYANATLVVKLYVPCTIDWEIDQHGDGKTLNVVISFPQPSF